MLEKYEALADVAFVESGFKPYGGKEYSDSKYGQAPVADIQFCNLFRNVLILF